MKLAECSKDKFYASFEHWSVDMDFAEPIFNYLVYGYSPGSFFTSVLANDYHAAIGRSHPSNTIPALKALSGWMVNCMPREAFGSYDAVNFWCNTTPAYRRKVLEAGNLIYKAREETWQTLKGSEYV